VVLVAEGVPACTVEEGRLPTYKGRQEGIYRRGIPLPTYPGRHIWGDIPLSGPPLGGIYGEIYPSQDPLWEAYMGE